MGRYFIRRVLYAVPALLVISFISFLLIQLPPGTFADTVAAEMMETASVNESAIRAIEERYGLNQPIMVQYWKWISGILLRGDFGESFIWNRPVAPLMWERLGLTLVLTASAFIFVCVVVGADRHLLRGAAVLGRRLHRHLARFPRPGGAQLPVRPDPDVHRLPLLRHSIGGFFSPISRARSGAGRE